MQRTVLLLNIEGLDVAKFNYWLKKRDGGRIWWRHRLNCRNIGADLDWLINYNE